jgi:hypothetical protein
MDMGVKYRAGRFAASLTPNALNAPSSVSAEFVRCYSIRIGLYRSFPGVRLTSPSIGWWRAQNPNITIRTQRILIAKFVTSQDNLIAK